ncbi:MAG: class I SAM-dependent methyltransferase [Bacteroidetes bacterium]|nr:class I SAM-dependent methyltransferase [Bacteroidota bacterium]
MILHKKCPLCNSASLLGYAMDLKRKGPHISRVKCQECRVVFANPMADEKELQDYYQHYYEKDLYEATHYKSIILNHFKRIATLEPIRIKKEARYLGLLQAGHTFLDVGCGLGLGLAYAHRLDCTLFATEFDQGALDFVQEHFPVSTYQGDIWGAKYPEAYFDFIHISHVIEHVLDPIAYLKEMKRILKPGGILAIGTPDSSSKMYSLHRTFYLLHLQVPDIVDGLEHTFIFPKATLAALCKQQGFLIEDHYTHSLGEKLSNLLRYKLPLVKKINRLIQNAFHVNQWIVCKKPLG